MTRSRTLEPRKQIAFQTRRGEAKANAPRQGNRRARAQTPQVRKTDGRTDGRSVGRVYPSIPRLDDPRVGEGERVRGGSLTLGILLACVSGCSFLEDVGETFFVSAMASQSFEAAQTNSCKIRQKKVWRKKIARSAEKNTKKLKPVTFCLIN